MRVGVWAVGVLGFALAGPARSALAQAQMPPEARQVLHGYRDVFRALPRSAQTVLLNWLGDWPALTQEDRARIVEVFERLRYFPADAVEAYLRDLPPDRRRQGLADLALGDDFFRDQPTRALVVLAGAGTPSEVVVGAEGRDLLGRTWGRLRPQGLLLRDTRVAESNRSPPRWAAALATGRYVAVDADGRPPCPTLFEAVRKTRGLAPTGAWLVTCGPLLARADCSSHADFGKDFGALVVTSDLLEWAAERRAEYVERAVRQGIDRRVADAQASALRPEQLGLDRLFPDAGVRAFVWDRMTREPGPGVRNTFVYLTALRVLQDYRPHLVVVCFGEPGEDFETPPAKPRREDVRSDADYRREVSIWQRRVAAWREALPRRRYQGLADLDVYIDSLHREFQRNPYYGPRGMFMLILGDPGTGEVQTLIASPGTPPGAHIVQERGLIRLAPTVAKFMDVPMPMAAGAPIEEAFPADETTTRPAGP